jgi:hypothetical protein
MNNLHSWWAEDMWERFIEWFYGWPYRYPLEFRGMGYCKTWPTRFREEDDDKWERYRIAHRNKTCRCFRNENI